MNKKLIATLLLIVSLAISANANEGWESLENWRKLEAGQNPKAVEKILGSPERINGGSVATWDYPNGGRATFIQNKVTSWHEPNSFKKLTSHSEGMGISSGHVTMLPQEIQDLKKRISALEAIVHHSPDTASANGHWNSIPNWRKLKAGMTPREVRLLLGEPLRIRSSISTTWEYPKDGKVEFLVGELVMWNEPAL